MLQTEKYQMKEVCDEVGITYETLKYYCNEGLVPNHERNKNNYRIFDDKDVNWIKGLTKLRECGMSIKDMKNIWPFVIKEKSLFMKEKRC